MAAFSRRTFLARNNGLSAVERIYRTRDAIEVDEIEGYDVSRRRVLFDEVMLLTRHQEVGWAFVLVLLAVMTFTAFFTMIIAIVDWKSGVLSGLFLVAPLVALIALRLILRVDVVTVHGPRSRARMSFWFNKDRGREVFRMITRLAREHQERAARARGPSGGAAPPAPAAPPGPPAGAPPGTSGSPPGGPPGPPPGRREDE